MKADKGSQRVSIIMAVHNAEPWIQEAIDSVLAQTHEDLELIIVDDGSTDRSPSIVRSYRDERIQFLQQERKGVSVARNRGIERAEGDFLLFLDADDVLFPRSLECRLEKFEADPELAFVDGSVWVTGADTKDLRWCWTPSFEGDPRSELLEMKGTCFVTISWMIRVDPDRSYRFDERLSHCEDLDLFISIADQGKYGYVEEPIMYFRRSGRSAMRDLEGLERGYRILVSKWEREASKSGGIDMKKKSKKILFRSYLKKGALFKAFQSQMGW